jgi:hypothetical protein
VYQIGREPVRNQMLFDFPAQTNLWRGPNVPGAILRFTGFTGRIILERIK